MTLLVTEYALRDRRRGIVGWSLGIAVYVAVIASVYPSVHDSQIQKAIRDYPKELKAFFGGSGAFDFSTGAGYLNVELFSLVIPALLAVVAIGYGAGALAGEEESGFLDLLLAQPIERRRVVGEHFVALVGLLAVLGGVIGATVLVMGTVIELDIGVVDLVAAVVGVVLVALFLGLLAMVVGALTGSRSVSVGVAAAVFAAAYLLVGLAGLVSWLEPVRYASPLYHATGTSPIQHGFPVNFVGLALGCGLAVVATVVAFDRRYITR